MKFPTLMVICVTLKSLESAKILAVIPTVTSSHYNSMRKIILELAGRNHRVVCLSPFEEKNPPENFEWVHIDVKSLFEPDPSDAKEVIRDLNFFSRQKRLWTIMNKYTSYILKLEKLRKFIEEDQSKFDLVIAEDFFQPVFYGFSYKYDAPLILVSSFGMAHYISDYIGNPIEISYVPHEFSDLFGKFTIFDRFYNLVCTVYDIVGRKYYSLAYQNEIAKRIFPNVPDLEILESNTSLVLINSHFSLSVVKPYLPNIIEIGGIHIDEVKPLANDLKAILDGAENGAILLSFGSVMELSMQPEDKVLEILKALGKLKQTVLIKWNSDKVLPVKYDNIYPYKWLPQNDVLAHPNLHAFITHGGLLSAQEAIFHGVPTICIPFYGDQPLNCLKSVQMGYGVDLSMKNINENTLYDSIQLILNDKYRLRARELAGIFRDRPQNIMNATIYWIEYVIRHKGADFIKSPKRYIPWYSYYMVDIGLLGIMFMCLVCYIVNFVFKILKRKIGAKIKIN